MSTSLGSTIVNSYLKLRSVVTLFSPDVVLLIFRTSETMLEPSVVMYIYYGICQNMYPGPSDLTCGNLSQYPDSQDAVQMKSAKYITWYRFLWNLPALGLTLFCGSWSDKVGRKLVMVLPCLGTILAVMIYLISTIKQGYYLPMVLCGAIIRGTFGGSAVLLMAVQSCVSDMTSLNNRTWRFGFLLAMNYFGNVLGYIIMGIVLRVSNFAQVFTVVISLQATCILWAVLFMQDSIKTPEDSPTSGCHELENEKPAKVDKSLFRIQHIRNAWDVVAKKRGNAGRLHLAMLLVAIVINQIGREVEGDIVVLFVERRPLNWSKSMYGYLAATDYMCMGLLVCFVLPLLSYRYQVPDMYLIMLGLVFKMIRLLLLAFSIHTWMVYCAMIAGSLIAITVSALKSLISKMVDNNEIGKLFSIVSFVETLSSLFGSLVFSNLYAVTAAIFPGFSFLVTSVLYLILLVLMAFLTKDMLSRPSYGTLHEDLDSPSDHTELKVTSLTINQSSDRQQQDDMTLALTKDVPCNGVKSYHSIESETHAQSSSQSSTHKEDMCQNAIEECKK